MHQFFRSRMSKCTTWPFARVLAAAVLLLAVQPTVAQQTESQEATPAHQAELELTLVHSFDKGSTIYHVDFLPDGKRVVLGGDMVHRPISVWDVEKNTVVDELEQPDDWYMSVAASPDGKYVVSSGLSGAIKIWSLETSAVENTLVHPGIVSSYAFTPDGQTLATSGTDGTARLWDMRTRKRLHVLKGHNAAVTGLAFTPDGKQLVTGSLDNTVRKWDATSGDLIQELPHPAAVWSIAVSPDRKLIASGAGGALIGAPSEQMYAVGDDNTIRLWDIETGRLLRQLRGHTHVVRRIAMSPDGRLAASAGLDNTLRLWHLGSGKELDRVEGDGWVISVDFSPDGKFVVAVGGVRKEGRDWHRAPDERARLFEVKKRVAGD